MKRTLASTLVGLSVASLLFTGCGTSSTTSTSSESAASTTTTDAAATADATAATDSGEEVTLTYVTWNENQKDSIQATIDAFEAKYPNIKVELQITPWGEYWTKLEAATEGGELPDIITQHTNQIEYYVNAGVMAPLDDLTNYDSNFSYDNYDSGITNLYVYDGVHYGVPKDKDCIVLAYNTKLFDDAGVEYPNEDWTWDDIEAAAEKITDKDNNIYGFNAYNNDQEGYGSFLYENGGGFIDETNNVSALDTEESISAMEWYMDMNAKYSPSYEVAAETDCLTLFASGSVAMMPVGNWQLSYFTDNDAIKDNFQICALPAAPDGNRVTISNGLALSIPANCENMDAAKTFVAFAGSEEGMKAAASGPAIPCYNGVDKDWADAHKDLYDTDAILNSLQYGHQLRGSELKGQWGAAMYEQIGYIFDGTKSVEDAFKEASTEMNEILAQEK